MLGVIFFKKDRNLWIRRVVWFMKVVFVTFSVFFTTFFVFWLISKTFFSLIFVVFCLNKSLCYSFLSILIFIFRHFNNFCYKSSTETIGKCSLFSRWRIPMCWKNPIFLVLSSLFFFEIQLKQINKRILFKI